MQQQAKVLKGFRCVPPGHYLNMTFRSTTCGAPTPPTMPSCRIEDEMKIAVSAQEQELRVHLTAAILERPEFELHVLGLDDVDEAVALDARAVLLQWPSTIDGPTEARIRELAGRVPVIVVTDEADKERAAASLTFGARGLLLSDRTSRTIQSSIFSILEGGSWIDPHILPVLLSSGSRHSLVLEGATTARRATPGSALSPDPRKRDSVVEDVPTVDAVTPESADHRPLTSREKQVAGLISRGLTNLEIAEQLGVDESTVKTHIGSILRKVKLRDRLQVALWFHGLPIGNDGGALPTGL